MARCRSIIEGFTGNGAGSHNGDGAGNPLNGVAELIAPILERFTGKPVDDAALQAAVTAALEAQRAKETAARAETPAGKRGPLEATDNVSRPFLRRHQRCRALPRLRRGSAEVRATATAVRIDGGEEGLI